MDSAIITQLERIRSRFDELTEEMGRPEVAADFEQLNKLARERAEIQDVVQMFAEYEAARKTAEDAQAMLSEGDAEMKELAEMELAEATASMEELGAKIRRGLLPRDPRDSRNVIMEIRAGAGGEEAALFGFELYRAYARYAERKHWHTEILSASESEKGGFKEVVFEVRGDGAYSRLKYESGVHRMQSGDFLCIVTDGVFDAWSYNTHAAGTFIYFQVTYLTNDPWPSSLPGTV